MQESQLFRRISFQKIGRVLQNTHNTRKFPHSNFSTEREADISMIWGTKELSSLLIISFTAMLYTENVYEKLT